MAHTELEPNNLISNPGSSPEASPVTIQGLGEFRLLSDDNGLGGPQNLTNGISSPIAFDSAINTTEINPEADLTTNEVCATLEVTRAVLYAHGRFNLVGRHVSGGRKVYKGKDVISVREEIEEQRKTNPGSIPRNIEVPADCVDLEGAAKMLGMGITAIKDNDYFGLQTLRFSGMKYYFKIEDVLRIKKESGIFLPEEIQQTHMSMVEAMITLGMSHTHFHRQEMEFVRIGNQTFYPREKVMLLAKRRDEIRKAKEKQNPPKIKKRKKAHQERTKSNVLPSEPQTTPSSNLNAEQQRMFAYYLGEIDKL